MTNRLILLATVLFGVAFIMPPIVPVFAQKNIKLQNEAYVLDITSQSIQVSRKGQNKTTKLRSELTIFYTDKKLEYSRHRTKIGRSPVASWGKNPNLWESASITKVIGRKITQINEHTIRFSMKNSQNAFSSLLIELPQGDAVPVISWGITPKKDGWFSVGFTGLSSHKPNELDFMYQPLVWTWKRFPDKAFLTPEAFATTGASFVTKSDLTEGLHVHPKEVPFRYASMNDSRFGIALRTEKGQAKPMIFAPVLATEESQMKKGQRYEFSIQYFMQEGDWQQGADYLYHEVIKYRKERENATVSLNKTFENMLDFAMDDEYSGWIEDWKGNDYLQDVPGTVKNVSALHPLSIALTTGSKEVYRKRALPTIEYMMSRQKYLFGVDTAEKHQSPSMFLKGPCAEIGELSGLHQMTNFRNDAFLKEIERLFGQPRMLNLTTKTISDSWQDYLARYKISNDEKLLAQARKQADEYLKKYVNIYPEDFTSSPGLKDHAAYFVTDFGVKWYDLIELYEVTNDKKYLEAAEMGAMEMLLWTRSLPFSHPDSLHLYNEGGQTYNNSFRNRIERTGITSPQEIDNFQKKIILSEQKVPAWRASFVGLPPESSYTYFLGSIMLTHHAAWMLRLAHLTENKLLADAAYNAVVGRYANFPGYYFRSYSTNIYQLPDYTMKRYKDVPYNNIFYNHVWPHLALIQDFIVSDVYYKSEGNVDFPSVYAPGYAFLTSKVYGHETGKIYDNEGVNLWLPQDGLFTSEIALNNLWGWDGENTYVVLTNTSDEPVNTTIYINPDVISWDAGQKYKVVYYAKNGNKSEGSFKDGKLSVEVPANGIQTVKMVGLKTQVLFQAKATMEYTPTDESKSCGYFRKEHGSESLGTLTGMRFKMADFDNVYVYTDATPSSTTKVELAYKVGDYEWEQVSDDTYPFEFSIPIFAKNIPVKVKWIAYGKNGKVETSKEFELCE